MPSCTSALLYKIWEHWNEISQQPGMRLERVHREIWDPAMNPKQRSSEYQSDALITELLDQRQRSGGKSAYSSQSGGLSQTPLSHWTHGRVAEASLFIAARVEALARQLLSHCTHGRGVEASLLIAARVEASARHL